jgi:hypothetical protein
MADGKLDHMKFTYGLADFDRFTGKVNSNIHVPMDVPADTIYEFLRNAGEKGWELCAAFPGAPSGSKHGGEPGPGQPIEELSDVISFIFKRS